MIFGQKIWSDTVGNKKKRPDTKEKKNHLWFTWGYFPASVITLDAPLSARFHFRFDKPFLLAAICSDLENEKCMINV